MRAVSPVVDSILICACAALGACQDSYASNAGRDTHMGDLQAAVAASVSYSPFSALPPPMEGTAAAVLTGAAPAMIADAGSAQAKDAGVAPHHAKP